MCSCSPVNVIKTFLYKIWNLAKFNDELPLQRCTGFLILDATPTDQDHTYLCVAWAPCPSSGFPALQNTSVGLLLIVGQVCGKNQIANASKHTYAKANLIKKSEYSNNSDISPFDWVLQISWWVLANQSRYITKFAKKEQKWLFNRPRITNQLLTNPDWA